MASDTRVIEAERRHSMGDAVSAVALCKEVLKEDSRQSEALHILALVAMQSGNVSLALQLLESALAANPSFSVAWFNRAVILHGLKRIDEAAHSVALALEGDSELAAGWDLRGLLEQARGDTETALRSHQRAVTLQPQNAYFYGNFAVCLLAQSDLRGAYAAAQKAEALDAAWPPMVLGHALKAMGYPDLAIQAFARTRALQPALVEATVSEAMARLQTGDFEKGLALWEQRPDLSPDLQDLPFWQGQDVESLLIYEDQGLGDAIHFARYIPWLCGKIKKLYGRVAPSLHDLFMTHFADVVWCLPTDVPPVAARCRLSSLPFFASTRLETIPALTYLLASSEKSFDFQQRLATYPMPRIGLVWAGNTAFRGDKQRTLPAYAVRKLIAAIGASHLVSLQKNVENHFGLFDLGECLHDFTDTAAALARLDVVITVDTAVAHVAGAMGRPVFILLPFDNDWRWLIGREDSPWYPSARLFRQKTPGLWDDVIDRVAAAVQALIAGDHSVLCPPVWRDDYLTKNPKALELNS